MESILTSIKKLLNIDEGCTDFDTDIIIHINSVLMILTQLGIGPTDGFEIENDKAKWSDFLGSYPNVNAVRSYVYFKVRLMFDPPGSSAAIESMNKLANELEWRINATAEKNAG